MPFCHPYSPNMSTSARKHLTNKARGPAGPPDNGNERQKQIRSLVAHHAFPSYCSVVVLYHHARFPPDRHQLTAAGCRQQSVLLSTWNQISGQFRAATRSRRQIYLMVIKLSRKNPPSINQPLSTAYELYLDKADQSIMVIPSRVS